MDEVTNTRRLGILEKEAAVLMVSGFSFDYLRYESTTSNESEEIL